MDLKGHSALITGGTQGVGAAIAYHLAKAGANVIIHGLRDDSLAQATLNRCAQCGVKATLLCYDLFQPLDDVVREVGAKACEIDGSIDLLVNNAGVFIDHPFLSMDVGTYQKTFHLNVGVGYFLSQFFANRWIDRGVAGRVVFTGSINGLLAETDHTAYDSSKAAVAGLVRSLCVALAPHRIRVNSMAPGLVRTPLTNQVLDKDIEALHWMEMHTPNGRVPDADVCGPMVAFLLSDEAEHIHGQTIYVDGGMSAWQQPDAPKR
jgi:NAD(P)-dependent dehydrogenase (short-subunit alcohol dehydrogenase family)